MCFGLPSCASDISMRRTRLGQPTGARREDESHVEQIQPSWAWPPSARTGHPKTCGKSHPTELGLDQADPSHCLGIVVTQQYLQLQAESVDIQKRHSLRLFRKHRESRAWGWGQEKQERSWPWCFWHKQLVWYWCLTEVENRKNGRFVGKDEPPWPGWLETPRAISRRDVLLAVDLHVAEVMGWTKDGPQLPFGPRSLSCSYLLSVCPCWESDVT